MKITKNLRMLCILAVVAVVHGLILLSLKLAPAIPAQETAPAMTVQMLNLAPEPPPVEKPPEPEPEPEIQTSPPVPVAVKAAIALPEIRKVPVHKTPKKVDKVRPVEKPQPAAETTVTRTAPVAKPAVSHIVSQPVFSAAYLNNPAPEYPRLSRRLREEGKVILNVQVSPAGLATSVSVSTTSGFPRLDQAAVDAVKRWRFVPAKNGSEPVAAWVQVPLVFALSA